MNSERAAEVNGEIERGDGEGDDVGGFVRFDGAHMKLLHVGTILACLESFRPDKTRSDILRPRSG